MKAEILKVLKSAGTYVSGQALCERFGVSRTAVWKVIRQLQEEGYDIEAVRNRGYLYRESGDIYNAAELQSLMKTIWAGKNLIFLEQVDSTNNEIRRQAEQGAPEGTLAVAVEQTAGKGRRGRHWDSPGGDGIWMSLLLRPDFAPECASMLTLVAAMAVRDGIYRVTGLDCKIKWPNDLVLEGRKAVGILTEMSTEVDYIRHVVIGIGINVGTKEFPEEIRATATSLALHMEGPVKRAPLVCAVMESFEKYYGIFKETLDLSKLREEYNQELVNLGKEVRVMAPGQEYNGVARGINGTGELLVETRDGAVRQVVSGEVSVRGVYGYV